MQLTRILLATLTLAPTAFAIPLTSSGNNTPDVSTSAYANNTMTLQTREVGCPFSENKCRKEVSTSPVPPSSSKA